MHDNTTGKIQPAHRLKPATRTPDPVGQRVINKSGPEKGKKQKSRKLHSFRISTNNQSRRNDGEHSLKNHKDRMGNCFGIVRVRQRAHSTESRPVQIADDAVEVRPERQGIAEQHPL